MQERLPIRDSDGASRPDAKRRKVRKGTRSCWECRRRKIRCVYQSDDAPTCINCEARGSKCVSQEFAIDESPNPERRITQRLGRVEEMLEKLVEKIMPDSYASGRGGNVSSPPASVDDDNEHSVDPSEGSCPIQSAKTPILALLGSMRDHSKEPPKCPSQGPPTPAPSHGESSSSVSSKTSQVAKALYALFPSQQDLDGFTSSIGIAWAYAVLTFACRHEDIIEGRTQSIDTITLVPPPTTHPVVLAKRLMQLACFMQQLENNSTRTFGSGQTAQSLMFKIVSLVSETVAHNDTLVGNVEGIETIALLALYQTNAGNLRKAWLLMRRTISVAQLMGVDRGDDKPLISADPLSDPRTRAKSKTLWFRLNFIDRYLSLLLGLPAGTDDNSFLGRVESDTPLDILEKQHCIAAGAIIKRNTCKGEVASNATQGIDFELETAARRLSLSFWQIPDYKPTLDTREVMKHSSQMMQQMNHHNLLILLHLPYVLRDPKERRWDYSKTTCVSSSRQLLRTFLVFRKYNENAIACRHTDYGALTAAMTLLLGYLDPKLQARDQATSARREADRSLIIEVRDKLQEMSKKIHDPLSRESAGIITRLLPLLDLNSSEMGVESEGQTSAEPVRLELPFLGTININPVPVSFADVQPHALTTMTPAQSHNSPRSTCPLMSTPSGSAQESGTTASASRFTPNSMPATTDWDAQQPNYFETSQEQRNGDYMHSFVQPMDYNAADYSSNLGNMPPPMMQFEWSQAQLAHPELVAEADQWTFQGFDTAYFESLFSSNIHML